MWKILLAVMGIIFSLCTMAGCEVEELGSLEELSRPYTGVYTCERLMLGDEELTEQYKLSLELEYGGDFTLTYAPKGGKKTEWSGTYVVDVDREEITMSAIQGMKTLSRTYRMEDGAILIDGNFYGKNFFAQFRMG